MGAAAFAEASSVLPFLLLDRSTCVIAEDPSGALAETAGVVRSALGPCLRLDWGQSPVEWNPLSTRWLSSSAVVRAQACARIGRALSVFAPEWCRPAAARGAAAGCAAVLWLSALAAAEGPLATIIPSYWGVSEPSLPRVADWLAAAAHDPAGWCRALNLLSHQDRKDVGSTHLAPLAAGWMEEAWQDGSLFAAARAALALFADGPVREHSFGPGLSAAWLRGVPQPLYRAAPGLAPECAPPLPATILLGGPQAAAAAPALAALFVELALLLAAHQPPRDSRLGDWPELRCAVFVHADPTVPRFFPPAAASCDLHVSAASKKDLAAGFGVGPARRLGAGRPQGKAAMGPPWWLRAECLDVCEATSLAL